MKPAFQAEMASYSVLVVTNLWPTKADPSYGSFVKAQMESLRPLGVEFDVLFINGRESKWNYLRGVRQVRSQLRAKRYDLIHAHFGLSGWVARWQFRVPVVVSFMGDDVLGRPTRSGRITLGGHLLRILGVHSCAPGHLRDCEVATDGFQAAHALRTHHSQRR